MSFVVSFCSSSLRAEMTLSGDNESADRLFQGAGPSVRFGSMDDHNLRLPILALQGWAPRICPSWDSWSADAVEDRVPRTLALGGIVPILNQER